jgi:hypothetical protein
VIRGVVTICAPPARGGAILAFMKDCRFRPVDRGQLAADAAAKLEERRFIETLVANGQAAVRGKDGKLPPGVTHEIIGHEPDGLPIVKRIRFG